MKVLTINGSPEIHGCTDRALKEVEKILTENGIECYQNNEEPYYACCFLCLCIYSPKFV